MLSKLDVLLALLRLDVIVLFGIVNILMVLLFDRLMVKLLIIHYYIFHRFTDWHCTVLYCIAELCIVLHGFALLCCSYPRKRGNGGNVAPPSIIVLCHV